MRLVAGKGRSEVVIYAPKEPSKVGALKVNSPPKSYAPNALQVSDRCALQVCMLENELKDCWHEHHCSD